MLAEVDVRSPVLAWQIAIAMLIGLCVAFSVIRPYKLEFANHSGACLAALIGLYATLLLDFNTATVHTSKVVLAVGVGLLALPHFVFYGYVVYRLGNCLRQCDKDFKMALRKWCFGQSSEQDENMTLLN